MARSIAWRHYLSVAVATAAAMFVFAAGADLSADLPSARASAVSAVRDVPALRGRLISEGPGTSEFSTRSDARRERRSADAPTASPIRVLVILDGVRWQEVFFGVDPKLAAPLDIDLEPGRDLAPALAEIGDRHGAAIGAPGIGAGIFASGPSYKSMPGYMELFSGAPADYCPSNRCGVIPYPTLLDEVSSEVGVKPGDVAVFASWPHLIRAAAHHPETMLISAGRSGGTNLELLTGDPQLRPVYLDGRQAAPFPSKGDYRPDVNTAELALAYLASERPKFLVLSLGDADAYGHLDDYSAYLQAIRQQDQVVGEIAEMLRSWRELGIPTTLFVTADHGRDKRCKDHGRWSPESARVWLFAEGDGVHPRGYIGSPAPRRLADIAPTLRVIAGLPPATGAPRAGKPLVELLEPPAEGR